MSKEHIFVTGGAGFIGSRVCRRLVEDQYQVTCYDKLDPKSTNPRTIRDLISKENFHLVEGDILDLGKLKGEMGTNPDAVIHLAAISHVGEGLRHPSSTFMINASGTFNVLRAAQEQGVPRFHYASTDEVFGQTVGDEFNEHSTLRPRNFYAAGKAAGEMAVMAWEATHGLDVTITNSCNTYGPYQSPNKLIPKLTVRGLLDNTLTVYGSGKHIREWLFVDDHVGAILHVLDQGTFGERYLVGSGERQTNLEVIQKIANFLGLGGEMIEHVQGRPGDDEGYAIDSTALRGTGWQPNWNFDDGLGETTEWYRENRNWWSYFLAVYPDLKPEAGKEKAEVVEEIPLGKLALQT